MGRTRATQAAPAPAVTAENQTVQTEATQDGGQSAPVTEQVEQLNTVDQSAGEQQDQGNEGDKAPAVTAEPSLVIVNNSPSLQVIPMTDAVIEPYGSYVVPESVFEDADRIQRMKTEVSALNELRGYEMIELRFSVAATE